MVAADSSPRFAEPLRATRTFEAAIEHILEGIERSRLRHGDKLPNEGELALELGISKPTLRQALLVLQRSGVLDVRVGKNGGIFVATDVIPAEEVSTAVALEESAVVDVLRARRILEASVVRYAALVADDDDFAEIERTVDLLRAHLGDRAAVMGADAMFHRAVVRACRNTALQTAMKVVEKGLAPIRDLYRGGVDDAITLDVHARQLDAMRRRDPVALERVVDEHFRMLEDIYAEALGRRWDELFSAAAGTAPLGHAR